MQKALIHIGGSFLQLPSLRLAKELGLYLVLTDRNPRALGAAIADRFEVLDGEDVTGLLALAHEVAQEFDLVGAYVCNDFGLKAVATIAETFGLPGCSLSAVQKALDKSTARQIWSENGLPVPQGAAVCSLYEAQAVAGDLGLPIIVKPIDSSGSRGVRSVWDKPELVQAYEEAHAISDTVLVEALVTGRHVDVNGLFLDDQFLGCGMWERFFSPPPFHYPIWGYQPASLQAAQEASIYELVERASRILSINAGPVKADLILGEDGLTLIELSPRFHGDVGTSYVTPLATGSYPAKAYFAYLIGDNNAHSYLKHSKSSVAGWRALFPEVGGRLKDIKGIELAKSLPGVYDVFVRVSGGTSIMGAHQDNTTVAGFVWAESHDIEHLRDVLETAASRIRFIVEVP